jgi:hypothetical protein
MKWAQIVLAILLTGLFVLLLPGGPPFAVLLGCLYIVWAVRARSNYKLSAWLAFVCSLALAVLGSIGFAYRVSGLARGRSMATVDFSIELILFAVAALVVVLHGVNWRWLLVPDRPPGF